jgi:UPF0716 protein FxsA
MRRLGLLVALLIVVSAVEIAVVIAVGHAIGWGWTLLLLLSTSLLGGWLLQREGGRAWRAFREDVSTGRPPGNTATDGVLVLAGGVFMLVPGFVSDAVGLFLLLPVTRPVARIFVQHSLASRLGPSTVSTLFGPRRVRARTGQPTAPGPGPGPEPGPAAPGERPTGSPGDPIEGEIIDP